ncbi:hypothetical protein [Oleiharenicola sp. Vm1]|uniref:hypothetical protein n=1 Tax=Oleiharenicola sp. Vm1 TaxID=3398393 RepID=UPI0039F5A974
MRGAAGEDDVADVRELEDGLGDLLLQLPERGVQADEFADRGADFRDAVLRQILGEGGGQAVVLEGLVEEVAVEQHPAGVVALEFAVEERDQLQAQRGGAGAGLAGEGDERVDFGVRGGARGGAGRAEPRMQDGQAVLEVGMRGHGASRWQRLTGAADGVLRR